MMQHPRSRSQPAGLPPDTLLAPPLPAAHWSAILTHLSRCGPWEAVNPLIQGLAQALDAEEAAVRQALNPPPPPPPPPETAASTTEEQPA
jgi:hypothetical protein